MTLAQLGMRLKRTGTIASAPWSNLFPSTVDRWLPIIMSNQRWSCEHELFCLLVRSLKTADLLIVDFAVNEHSRHSDAGLADNL